MAKDWNRRLTEAVTLVKGTAPAGFVGDRQVVANALEGWMRTAAGDQRKRVSELMSQEGVVNRPAQAADRGYRRASILLKCALIEPDPTKWAEQKKFVNDTKSQSAIASIYAATLTDAHDAVCTGSLAGPNRDLFLTSPLEFLQKYKITVSGKGVSGPFEYGFAMDHGAYKIMAGNPHQTTTNLRAINVPAVLYSTIEDSLGAITGTRSSDHADCSVMLTTQFTGCTYCFMVSKDGSSLVAAHIDPGGGVGRASTHTGQSISKALRASGGFSNGNGGVFRAYGRVADGSADFGYPQSSTQMIIVALVHKGRWQVYAQISQGAGFRVERID